METRRSPFDNYSGTQRVVKNLDNLLTNFVLDDSRSLLFRKLEASDKDVATLPDVILVADLNTTNPTAGFVAPSLGFPRCMFLPVLQEIFEERKGLSVSPGVFSEDLKCGQPNHDWTKNFLSRCKTLLQSELGMPLDTLNVHISFTTRGDISELDKATLVKDVDNAGFKKSKEDIVLIFPTIDAVAIEAVKQYGNLNLNGDIQTNQPRKLDNGSHILVIYFDGDVAEIQSYSVFWSDTEGESATKSLRLEDIVYGETVDCGKLVDEKFGGWLKDAFGNSLEKLLEEEIGPNGELMNQFSTIRRNYNARRSNQYRLSLELTDPPVGAPYDIIDHVCILSDDKVQSFFEPAIEALLKSLDNHHAGIGKAKKTIDQTIFAGPYGIAPYVEDLVKDWGVGVGILASDTVLFRSVFSGSDDIGRFLRFSPRQEMITEGVIRGNYPEIDLLKRSRYHYGVDMSTQFERGDPEWSRWRCYWNDTDWCSAKVNWQLCKNQLLENHSRLQGNFHIIFHEGQAYNFDLKLYKCEVDQPPKWVLVDQNCLHPEVSCVGTVSVTFSQEDAEQGQYKQCSDGIYRRKLEFLVGVSVLPRLGSVRVKVESVNGGAIGSGMFRMG